MEQQTKEYNIIAVAILVYCRHIVMLISQEIRKLDEVYNMI